MIDNKDIRDLIEYSSYLDINDFNIKESPIFSTPVDSEINIYNEENIPLKTGMGSGFIDNQRMETSLPGGAIPEKIGTSDKTIGAIVGDGPQKVSTQPDNAVWSQMVKQINDEYKKQTSTYKYIGSQENISKDWNAMAQKVNKDPNTFFNTAKNTFAKVAQGVQTYRANQEYQGPENLQDASKTFMSILTNDMMQMSRGPEESNMAAASLEGTSMGKMLAGGGEEQQQLSWNVFEDFLIYTDKYAQFMKQANPNFDTSILFDMRDRYLDQATMTRGKEWTQGVSDEREKFLNEQKRIKDMMKENEGKDISMDVLSGLSSQFGALSQKTSEISSQILNMENISKENKEWEWSVQKSGEDVDEDKMGFVIEEDNTSRPTRKTSEAVKFAFDDEYFNQKALDSETPISLLAMQSEKAKQELIKSLSPEMLRSLIEKETSQGQKNRERREATQSKKEEQSSQQMLRTMGVTQNELTIPATEVNKNIMEDISQDFKSWGSGAEIPANYQMEGQADETQTGYVINQQDQSRRFTQQQELLNRLMIDPNSRNIYARENNIDPNIMNEWARNRFEQEKQRFGPTYEMDILSYAQSIVDPEEFKKSSFQNYDYSKGVSFEDVNQYFSQRPNQIYQQKEMDFQMMQRAAENQRKQASMNVWAAAMENMPEDENQRDAFVQDAANKFEVQVEEDSRILYGVREKANNQKNLESQRIQNEENSRMLKIGQTLENNILNKQETQMFNKGVAVKTDTPSLPPQVEVNEDPIYQSAVKSLENTGINAGLMMQRNVKEQDETMGEVNEAEVGFVRTRDGGRRPTKAQVLREQMIINPENFNLSDLAQQGVKYSVESAINTENILMSNQRNIQRQQSMMQNYEMQNTPEVQEEFNMQENIEEMIQQEIEERDFFQRRAAYGGAIQMARGGFKNFRRKGARKFESMQEDIEDVEEDVEDEEIEEPTPTPPVEQEPIEGGETIQEPPIQETPPIVKQQEILPMIEREEKAPEVNEQLMKQDREIENIKREEVDKNQIMTSSGQLISGPTATQIIKEQEKTDNREDVISYIEDKIQENNNGLSNNFRKEMNNTANNVSIENLNKACEGL